MSADLNAIKARHLARKIPKYEDTAAMIQALEEVREALLADVGWVETGHTILHVLERRMGADWLNGRGDSGG